MSSHALQRTCVSGRPARSSGLRVAGGQPRSELILLDVMMPGMADHAVLAKLQAKQARD